MFKLFYFNYGIMFCAIVTEKNETALLGYQNDGSMKHFYFLFLRLTL